MRAGSVLLALIGLVAGVSCHADNLFVGLRAEVEADHLDLSLADIADIQSRERNTAEQLGNVAVFKCPALALPCRLAKTDIAPAVQQKARQLGATLIWGSNETVVIKGRIRSLSLAPATDRAAIRILQLLDQGVPLALTVNESPASIDAPPGTAEFRPAYDQLRWIGSNSIELPINVLVDGVSVGMPVVRYSLRYAAFQDRYEPLPAVSERLPNDTPVSRPMAQGNHSPIPLASGKSQGQATLPSIAKNSKVRLLIDSGPVRIETEGTALADANLGETVGVRRTNGLTDVRGRVVDRGTVALEEN